MIVPLNKMPAKPPLMNGDCLSRDEFERRYHAMPKGTRAELIEGEVYMPSPARWESHGAPHSDVNTWLGTYRAHTPGTDAGDSATIRLDLENEPQPDASLIVLPSHGGRVKIDPDDYLLGSPDLIVEVSASSASIDRHRKFRAYQRNGVREYLIWRVLDSKLDWFVLRDTQFELMLPDADGYFRSQAFPGLWLDPAALIRRDLATVLAVLARGIASDEHTAFVSRLAAAAPQA